MDMPDFKNILIVRTDRIGDVVLTVPAIRALKKACPQARITVWASPLTRDLIDGLPFIDKVLIERSRRGWQDYFQFIGELRRRRFDLAVVYHTKRHSNLACFLAGIPHRLGYKNNKFGFLLNWPVEDRRHLGEKHEAAYCIDLLKSIGVQDNDLRLELAVHPDAEAWAKWFLADRFPGTQPVVALHPDSSCPTRRWPPELFAEVSDALAARGVRVMVVGAGSAKVLADRMRACARHSFLDMTGVLSMAKLVAVLRQADLMISNDSGPAHVAAACHIPVITLFFRNQPGLNPERWQPLGEKCVLLMNKTGEEIVIDKDSRVLSGRLDSTSPREVLAATWKLLGI